MLATHPPLPLVEVEPLVDAAHPEEAGAAAVLQEELRAALVELDAVNGDLRLWPPLLTQASPRDFSLALAGLVELDQEAQQRLLECTSTMRRLEELKQCVQATRSFYAAQAALRRLSSSLLDPGVDPGG